MNPNLAKSNWNSRGCQQPYTVLTGTLTNEPSSLVLFIRVQYYFEGT